MVNSIKGNCYIVDSAGVYLTGEIVGVSSAGAVTGPYPDMLISAIRLVGAGSTSEMGLSYASANSLDVIHMKVGTPTGGADDINFATPFKVSERIYVRLLTAGTGYIYFS